MSESHRRFSTPEPEHLLILGIILVVALLLVATRGIF